MECEDTSKLGELAPDYGDARRRSAHQDLCTLNIGRCRRGAEHHTLYRRATMTTKRYKVGDHVSWNSEAGRVRGTISKVVTSEIEFKGYKVHASKDEPQYEIKSDKTDHIAMHKGSVLRKISG
jgi:hypothetical protein